MIMGGTYRGMAVLIIAMRTGKQLVPPFPRDLERAVSMLALRLEQNDRTKKGK